MDSDQVRLGLVALTALVGGSGVGWWLRGRYNWSRSVMMDELWTRKIRSYEVATEEARLAQTMTQTKMAGAQTAFAKEEQRAEQLQATVLEYDMENGRLNGALATHRERIENIEVYAAELDSQLGRSKEQTLKDAAKLLDLQKRIQRLRSFPARLEESEAELASLASRSSDSEKEKDAEIARLSDWIAELTPLTETLRSRDEQFARQSLLFDRKLERGEERLLAKEASLEENGRRIAELETQKRELETTLHESAQRATEQHQTHSALQDEKQERELSMAALELEIEQRAAAHETETRESIRLNLKVTELQVQLQAQARELQQQRRLTHEHEDTLTSTRERSASTIAELEDLRALHVHAQQAAQQGQQRSAQQLLESEQARGALATLVSELKQSQRKPKLEKKAKSPAKPNVSAKPAVTEKAKNSVSAKGSANSKDSANSEGSLNAKTKANTETETEVKQADAPMAKIKAKGSARKSATQTPAKPASSSPAPAKKAATKKASARKTAAQSSSAISVAQDDFRAIKGIGPTVVERLESAGIRTFAQLVSLGQADLGLLAKELGVPEKRIQREQWLEGALAILNQDQKRQRN